MTDDKRGTHARTSPSKDERVAHIAELMERLEWERGKTGKLLAKEWGLAEATVRDDAAEASRLVIGDPDEAQHEARRNITAGARKLLKQAVDEGDRLGFKQVADIWATVTGAKAPEKREISGPDGAPITIDARQALLERVASRTAAADAGDGEAEPDPKPEPSGSDGTSG